MIRRPPRSTLFPHTTLLRSFFFFFFFFFLLALYCNSLIMAQTAEPPRKRQRSTQFATRQKELSERREAEEKRKLQEEQRLQQRIDRLKTLEDISLDKRLTKFSQYVIDSGQPFADKITIGSNTTTKNAISAFKLYQMTKKVERIVEENPRDAIEYGVIIRNLKGIGTLLRASDDDEEEKNEEKTHEKNCHHFGHYFAVFNANFGHFNYQFDFSKVTKDAPKLLGTPLNECKYVKTYGNPIIMMAQSSFLKVLQLQSTLADKELRRRFRRRRQNVCDNKWPRCMQLVQEIVQKKERKEVKKGLQEQGYMFRIINMLCKKLPDKVNATFEQCYDNEMNELVEEYSFRVSRRLIIMSTHQLFSRADKRYHSN
eukprot:275104_1